MIRQFTLLVIYLALGFAAVEADQGRPPVAPVMGFAGYEYGSGITGIANDMQSEGYTLIDSTDSSLWYSSSFVGIDCELGYIFSSNRLVGGSFILKSVTERDFAKVGNHLNQVYEVRSTIQIKEDGVVVATIDAPDSAITHVLDLNQNTHEVTYIREE
jgi:opacity protein-like surface antigen